MSSILADQYRPSYMSPNARGGGVCRVSANENSCAHHVTWSPNKLWRSNSIFNLWSVPSRPPPHPLPPRLTAPSPPRPSAPSLKPSSHPLPPHPHAPSPPPLPPHPAPHPIPYPLIPPPHPIPYLLILPAQPLPPHPPPHTLPPRPSAPSHPLRPRSSHPYSIVAADPLPWLARQRAVWWCR